MRVLQSSAEQKHAFQGMVELASGLQTWERDHVLKIVECAHIPHVYQYLPRDEKGVTLASGQPATFVGAVYGIAREAIIFGARPAGPLDGHSVSHFTEAEITDYARHKPRSLSYERLKLLGRKSGEPLFDLTASTLFDMIAVRYLREAQKKWPDLWNLSSYSDFVAIQPPIPAPREQRLELIRRLVRMRLSHVPETLIHCSHFRTRQFSH